MNLDIRLQQLSQWLYENIQQPPGALYPITGDASFRRYFRFWIGSKSYIAMDAPPAMENCQSFVTVAERLSTAGLQPPHIYAADLVQGFLWLQDFGKYDYLTAIKTQSVALLYEQAITALIHMQQHADWTDLPNYDAQLLHAELELFDQWYLQRHCGVRLSEAQRTQLNRCFERLCQNALEQPQTFVHRDYHSRNLMYTDLGQPGLLDFQDAVRGPICYDLVSLARDCYIRWSAPQCLNWIEDYLARSEYSLAPAQFMRWFDLTGIQRHLKAIGIFARLNYRDAKPHYLNAIPQTLAYLIEVCAHYPEFASLAKLLRAPPR